MNPPPTPGPLPSGWKREKLLQRLSSNAAADISWFRSSMREVFREISPGPLPHFVADWERFAARPFTPRSQSTSLI